MLVVKCTTGEGAYLGVFLCTAYERQFTKFDLQPNPALLGNLQGVPQQAEAGDIRGAFSPRSTASRDASRFRRFIQPTTSSTSSGSSFLPLERRGGHAKTKRLGQHQPVARVRAAFGQHFDPDRQSRPPPARIWAPYPGRCARRRSPPRPRGAFSAPPRMISLEISRGRSGGRAATFSARKGCPPMAYTSERLLAAAMAP